MSKLYDDDDGVLKTIFDTQECKTYELKMFFFKKIFDKKKKKFILNLKIFFLFTLSTIPILSDSNLSAIMRTNHHKIELPLLLPS